MVPLLEPFADGELSPEKVVEVEQHLEECALCVERMRLGHALRVSLRQVVQSSSVPSDAFRARLAAAMEATRQREWDKQAEESRLERQRMLPWRMILPVAAAASLMLVWTSRGGDSMSHRGTTPVMSSTADTEATEATIEELVSRHILGKPASTILPDQNLVQDMAQEVGVPVRLPSLVQYGGHFRGGSVVPVHNMATASLSYEVAGHSVTLYVYDSSRLPLARRLNQRWVGDAEVYVGKRRGYSIAANEHSRVGYAVASDLSDTETAELVAALH